MNDWNRQCPPNKYFRLIQKKKFERLANQQQIKAIRALADAAGRMPEDYAYWGSMGKTSSLDKLTYRQAVIIIKSHNNEITIR